MKRFLCFLFLAVLLTGCAAPGVQPEQKQYNASFLDVFDTVTTIVGKADSEEAFREKTAGIHDELRKYHQLFDIYNDYDGIANLKTINDNAGIAPVPVDPAVIDLLTDCRRYYEATSRRISFEYAMIQGVNDTEEAAKELLRRMKGLPAHFNLIPLNHVEESPLKPSSKAAVAAFQKILEDGGITATVRRTLGGDIDASCGQLRRKYHKESK